MLFEIMNPWIKTVIFFIWLLVVGPALAYGIYSIAIKIGTNPIIDLIALAISLSLYFGVMSYLEKDQT